jgi:hypothetical protein
MTRAGRRCRMVGKPTRSLESIILRMEERGPEGCLICKPCSRRGIIYAGSTKPFKGRCPRWRWRDYQQALDDAGVVGAGSRSLESGLMTNDGKLHIPTYLIELMIVVFVVVFGAGIHLLALFAVAMVRMLIGRTTKT